MFRIDAHHHSWLYNAAEYDWLDGDLAMLRRDFCQKISCTPRGRPA